MRPVLSNQQITLLNKFYNLRQIEIDHPEDDDVLQYLIDCKIVEHIPTVDAPNKNENFYRITQYGIAVLDEIAPKKALTFIIDVTGNRSIYELDNDKIEILKDFITKL